MVQMKDEKMKTKKVFQVYFISHMVQMKEVTISGATQPEYNLYIPHGSDESWVIGSYHNIFRVFISHMVQMKAYHGISSLHQKQTLYPTWFR